jgi:hypothetical protein
VRRSDGGVREMIEVRHIDKRHVDINGLGRTSSS